MDFVRVWQGLYIISLVYSLGYRLFDYHVRSTFDVMFNFLTIVLAIIGWIFYERKNPVGAKVLKIMSISRMLVIIINATIIFGFIMTYIPSGPALWFLPVKQPAPVFWGYCLFLLVIECFYFKKLQSNKVN